MTVKIGKRLWKMDRREYKGLLKTAKEQVPLGIYAVEKDNYAELCNIRCESRGQLRKLYGQYKAAGFRVLFNQGGNAHGQSV